ncbi:kinase-like domain-containing protein, partial [Mycena floridula]
VTWIFEPRRDHAVHKYSGGLQHPSLPGHLGHTINALQHFVYQFSKESIVLADIQTSASWDPDNRAPVLFDLMTHTLYRNTGAGDFGTEGIEGFIEQHQCVPRCSYFGLTPVREDEE